MSRWPVVDSVITKILLLALAAGCLAAAPGAAVAETAAGYLQGAKTYLEKGKVRAAIIDAKNALQQEPDNGEARAVLGQAYLQAGQVDGAEHELQRARKLGAPRPQWLLTLGKVYLVRHKPDQVLDEVKPQGDDSPLMRSRIRAERSMAYMMQGHRKNARTALDKALKGAPNDAEVLVAAARFHAAGGDVKTATQYIKQAIETNPKNLDAWLLRAGMLRSQHQYHDALSAYEKAISVAPESLAARFGKVMMLVATGQDAQARTQLEALKRTAEKAPIYQYLDAVLAFREKHYDTAVASLQRVLRDLPDHMPSHLLLGIISYRQGHLESAESNLSTYLAAEPKQLPAAKLLAATRLKLKNPSGALSALIPFLKDHPKDAQLLALAGTAYLKNHEYERGVKLLKQAAEIAPNVASIRTQLGLGFLGMGNFDQAASDLKSAVDMGKAPVQTDVLLVLVRMLQKQYDQAIEAAQALAKKEPKSPLPENLLSAAYLGKGDRAAARQHLDKAIKLDPKYAAARLNLARLDVSEGQTDAARAQYQRILKDHPGQLRALLELAVLADRAGQHDKAVKLVEQAADANPDALQPAVLLTRYYLARGDADKALAVSQGMAQKHPDEPAALAMRAAAQLATGDTANAINTYQHLSKLNPKAPGPYILLARAYMKAGDSEYARKSVQAALKAKPDFAPALVMLGDLELRQDRISEARAVSAKLQKLYPKLPAGYRLEGDIDRNNGDYRAAAAAYNRGYQAGPSGALAVRLASTQKLAGNRDGAVASLRDWLSHRPADVEARLMLAGLYQTLGKVDDSIREYERVKAQKPNSVVAWNNLAWLYLGKDNDKALNYAQKAYDLAPQRPEVADTLGWILVKRGDTGKGLTLIENAAVHAPQAISIHYHLAVALNAAGRKEQARDQLQRILQSGKEFPEKAKARLLLRQVEPRN